MIKKQNRKIRMKKKIQMLKSSMFMKVKKKKLKNMKIILMSQPRSGSPWSSNRRTRMTNRNKDFKIWNFLQMKVQLERCSKFKKRKYNRKLINRFVNILKMVAPVSRVAMLALAAAEVTLVNNQQLRLLREAVVGWRQLKQLNMLMARKFDI